MSTRVKCIIKEEFRKDFEPIALRGEWGTSTHPVLMDFGLDDDSIAIPCYHCSFPNKWDGCDGKGCEYETSWDAETGLWVFAYSINRNRCNTYWIFDEYIVPIIVERFIKYEVWIEPMEASDSNEPVDITDTMNEFLVKYKDGDKR